jgi:hypothetical protein
MLSISIVCGDNSEKTCTFADKYYQVDYLPSFANNFLKEAIFTRSWKHHYHIQIKYLNLITPLQGERSCNAGNVKLVVKRLLKFLIYILIFHTWFSLTKNVSTFTKMSINYNPHNNSHSLLLQDYFLAVENWLKLRSYICRLNMNYFN